MGNLKREEEFLLKAYEIAAKQMEHEDTLRNNLLKFVLALFGAVFSAIYYLFVKNNFCQVEYKIPIFLFLFIIFFIILGIIIIIAKIRKRQLESMKISDNIRNVILGKRYNDIMM